jgi:hypothetical protein
MVKEVPFVPDTFDFMTPLISAIREIKTVPDTFDFLTPLISPSGASVGPTAPLLSEHAAGQQDNSRIAKSYVPEHFRSGGSSIGLQYLFGATPLRS